jgi:hypothetical protein
MGATGATGPQGPAAKTISVYDATNVVIGQWLPNDEILITSQGSPFYISATATGFVYSGVYFSSSDCTGAPYILPGAGAQLIPYASASAPGSSTVYVPGTTLIQANLNSTLQYNGQCYGAQFGAASVLPVTTVDLSAFVPPFSAH